MPRPQTKEDLLEAAGKKYDELLALIDSMTEEELNTPYDFSADSKKKEAHWKRDKNLQDVLMHLYEWHNLNLKWVEDNQKGICRPFLMEGYNWKTYGDMNRVFWKNCQGISLEDAMARFKESHKKMMAMIESMTNEELFSKGAYDWTGGNAVGAYCVSNTSSHYEWAMKKIKAHRRMLQKRAEHGEE